MLTVTLYQDTEGNDRFQVHASDGEGKLVEVTEGYDVFASKLSDGRMGWTVAEKEIT